MGRYLVFNLFNEGENALFFIKKLSFQVLAVQWTTKDLDLVVFYEAKLL